MVNFYGELECHYFMCFQLCVLIFLVLHVIFYLDDLPLLLGWEIYVVACGIFVNLKSNSLNAVCGTRCFH